MTREGDADVDLQPRCDIANGTNAQCFVSIHCNASEERNACGFEVYHYAGSSKGLHLANLLSTQILSEVGKFVELHNRGVKTADFFVFRHTAMPAALVEVAFISNPTEESWLADSSNQELVGKAIAKAGCLFLGVDFVDTVTPEVTPEKAIDWLAKQGVINSPDYWKTALLHVKNLDALFVKLYRVFRCVDFFR